MNSCQYYILGVSANSTILTWHRVVECVSRADAASAADSANLNPDLVNTDNTTEISQHNDIQELRAFLLVTHST